MIWSMDKQFIDSICTGHNVCKDQAVRNVRETYRGERKNLRTSKGNPNWRNSKQHTCGKTPKYFFTYKLPN